MLEKATIIYNMIRDCCWIHVFNAFITESKKCKNRKTVTYMSDHRDTELFGKPSGFVYQYTWIDTP